MWFTCVANPCHLSSAWPYFLEQHVSSPTSGAQLRVASGCFITFLCSGMKSKPLCNIYKIMQTSVHFRRIISDILMKNKPVTMDIFKDVQDRKRWSPAP